ncbi:MAG: hypothetical protein ACRBF0_16010 [Calditrichia bacterium]
MKRLIFILFTILAVIISGCSDDSNGYGNGGSIIDPIVDVDVHINEISYTGAEDIIELKNYGSEAVDVSNFFMCSLFSYTRVGELQIMSGSFTIPAGGILLVCGFELNDFVADLALYSSNAFEDPDAMLDFLQYGTFGNGRESVAIAKGIWPANDFILTVRNGHSLEYDGSGNASSDWVEQAVPTFGEENDLTSEPRDGIRINEVFYSPTDDQVELKNFGATAVDVSEWQWCARFIYGKISEANILSGTLIIPPGGILALGGLSLNETASDIAIYRNNEFANPDAMVDFMQYGSSGNGRESIAVAKGIWNAGEFVPAVAIGHSHEFDGVGRSITDWADQSVPSIGNENANIGPGN